MVQEIHKLNTKKGSLILLIYIYITYISWIRITSISWISVSTSSSSALGPSDLLRQNFFGGRALHVASISENPEVTRCRRCRCCRGSEDWMTGDWFSFMSTSKKAGLDPNSDGARMLLQMRSDPDVATNIGCAVRWHSGTGERVRLNRFPAGVLHWILWWDPYLPFWIGLSRRSPLQTSLEPKSCGFAQWKNRTSKSRAKQGSGRNSKEFIFWGFGGLSHPI